MEYEINKLKRRIDALKTEVRTLRYENTLLRKENISRVEYDSTLEDTQIDYMRISNLLIKYLTNRFVIDITKRIRKEVTVLPRMLYYHYMIKNTSLSLNSISHLLGSGHHHSTLIHARN